MGETEKNINDILEKLVIVTDAANNIFPLEEVVASATEFVIDPDASAKALAT